MAAQTAGRAGPDRRARLPHPGAEGADPARAAARLAERARAEDWITRSSWPPACNARSPPAIPRRRRPDPRRPVPGPQDPGGVRLRPRPRTQTRPDRPPGHPGLRHRERERHLPRPPGHRQNPSGHRVGIRNLPGRPPGVSATASEWVARLAEAHPHRPGCKPNSARLAPVSAVRRRREIGRAPRGAGVSRAGGGARRRSSQ